MKRATASQEAKSSHSLAVEGEEDPDKGTSTNEAIGTYALQQSLPVVDIGIPQLQAPGRAFSPLEVNVPEPVYCEFGPLQVPGRLRPQPTTAPASLRFVPLPDRSQQRQQESNRFAKPLSIQPISTQLDGKNWEQRQQPKALTTRGGSPLLTAKAAMLSAKAGTTERPRSPRTLLSLEDAIFYLK